LRCLFNVFFFFGHAAGGAAAAAVWDRVVRGSFPLMTRQKLKSSYLNSIRTNPHPLNYLYISGGVSSPHPPKTIFLRRDILFVRYVELSGIRSYSTYLGPT